MQESMRLEKILFLMALRYLTRLPVKGTSPQSDDLAARATKYHPTVGALVGLIGALVIWFGQGMWEAPVVILLSLAAGLLVTGAFHERGLARSAEALAEEGDRGEILRSFEAKPFGRVGTLTLGFVLALKVALLMSLPPLLAGLALIVACGVGRMAAVHVVATTHYAREEGLRAVVPKTTQEAYRLALLTCVLLLVMIAGFAGILAALSGFAGAVALGQVWRMRALRRLGGYTRDCLGGVEQLAELGFLLGLCLWL